MTGFIILGVIALLVGGAILAIAIRHRRDQRPRHAAMLIGGMMLTAFGLVITGFALVYNSTAPLDFNTAETAR
ncbi:MAG: hypothetical protein H0W71_08395 [Sphingomonas sp.]|nr:hypothetical protein [Sphingomonas sp.]